MPYKHIASYLKKTELACRLHYHQLSHGSNRRKRTSSITSSSPEASIHSEIPTTAPSPIHEATSMQPTTPPSYTYSPQSPHASLPAASTLLPRSVSSSPPRSSSHPVAILPKPTSPRRAGSEASGGSPLRLDCDVAPSSLSQSNVDMERLRCIYEAHRVAFWSQIAQEYGSCASPFLLEEAWKRGIATNAPPTPCVSPDTNTVSAYHSYAAKPVQQAVQQQSVAPAPTPAAEAKHTSATSISSLLGIVSHALPCFVPLGSRVPTLMNPLGCQPHISARAAAHQDDGAATRVQGRAYGRRPSAVRWAHGDGADLLDIYSTTMH
jgi:hypothetical protein